MKFFGLALDESLKICYNLYVSIIAYFLRTFNEKIGHDVRKSDLFLSLKGKYMPYNYRCSA